MRPRRRTVATFPSACLAIGLTWASAQAQGTGSREIATDSVVGGWLRVTGEAAATALEVRLENRGPTPITLQCRFELWFGRRDRLYTFERVLQAGPGKTATTSLTQSDSYGSLNRWEGRCEDEGHPVVCGGAPPVRVTLVRKGGAVVGLRWRDATGVVQSASNVAAQVVALDAAQPPTTPAAAFSFDAPHDPRPATMAARGDGSIRAGKVRVGKVERALEPWHLEAIVCGRASPGGAGPALPARLLNTGKEAVREWLATDAGTPTPSTSIGTRQ